MTWLQAVVLGIVQGLTEFIPISSTAHLRIVPALVGWEDPGAAFSAVIQIGTLLAVVIYFRQDIARITRGIFQGGEAARLGWMIAVGTLPIVGAGLLLKEWITTSFRSLWVISGSLIALALVLWLAERVAGKRRTLEEVGWGDAIVIGLAQVLALVPGASRSGVTITAGLFTGLTRETAARFSFLLSLPAVFAAGMYELVSAREVLLASRGEMLNLVLATLFSAVSGYAAIAFLLGYLRRHSTYLFIGYRLVLGLALVGLLTSGRLPAF